MWQRSDQQNHFVAALLVRSGRNAVNARRQRLQSRVEFKMILPLRFPCGMQRQFCLVLAIRLSTFGFSNPRFAISKSR
jgi:hypothetical protein